MNKDDFYGSFISFPSVRRISYLAILCKTSAKRAVEIVSCTFEKCFYSLGFKL